MMVASGDRQSLEHGHIAQDLGGAAMVSSAVELQSSAARYFLNSSALAAHELVAIGAWCRA